jgi:transcription termination factor Rho
MPDHKSNYEEMSSEQLHQKARQLGISGASSMKKEELVKAIEQYERSNTREKGGNH